MNPSSRGLASEEYMWDMEAMHPPNTYESERPSGSSQLNIDPSQGSPRYSLLATHQMTDDLGTRGDTYTESTRRPFDPVHEVQSAPGRPGNTPTTRTRRSRRQQLDWGSHRDTIRQLYLEEDKSLSETMQIMKEDHLFDAPVKSYKEKFKEWKWQKYLLGEHAQWMMAKADKRKREEGKDTVFIYGGSKWTKERAESSASRSKKRMLDLELIQAENHPEIAYKTPQARQATGTPQVQEDIGTPNSLVVMDVMEVDPIEVIDVEGDIPNETTEDEDEDELYLRLTWQGYSRTDLNSMLELAKQHRSDQAFSATEGLFRKVFQGYTKILSSTHEDTNEVGYLLATFYAEQDRMDDANDVIEEMSKRHIERWGIEGRQTRQHVLHVVELLNGWNRATDALAFLSRAWDLAAGPQRRAIKRGDRTRTKRRSAQQSNVVRRNRLLDVMSEALDDTSPSRVDAALGLAQAHIEAKDGSVEAFLSSIIQLCDNDLQNLAKQALKARAGILRLYLKMHMAFDRVQAFEGAVKAMENVWDCYTWEQDSFESLDVLEASMEASAALLKAGYSDEARKIFRRVDQKAETLFGREDERTIWIYISVGLVYQREEDWHEALPWFEQALSAAMDAYSPGDGIVKSLENALQKRHLLIYPMKEGHSRQSLESLGSSFVQAGCTWRSNWDF